MNTVNKAILFFLVASVFSLIVFETFSNSLHKRVDGASDIVSRSLAVALTRYKSGGWNNYVSSVAVFDELKRAGINGNSSALRKVNLSPDTLPAATDHYNAVINSILYGHSKDQVGIDSENVETLLYQEGGYADYLFASFMLVGPYVESTPLIFLLIILISSLAFMASHQNQSSMVLLSCWYLSLFVLIFDAHTWTFVNARFFGVLGVLPALHVCLLFFKKEKKWIDLAACLVQGCVFAFAYHSRNSAGWIIFPVLTVGFFVLLQKQENTFVGQVRTICLTLASFALPAIAGVTLYLNSLHHSYYSDDYLPYHMRYHSAFVGLAQNPDLENRFKQQEAYQKPASIYFQHFTNYNGGLSDTLPVNAAANDLILEYTNKKLDQPQKRAFDSYMSAQSGTYKIRAHDRRIKDLYIKFLIENPIDSFFAHLYKVK
ncbi:hypothetical protein OBA45_01205, partial [bacterium]|nr:hypothetical protein [bacterium]